MHVCTRAMEKEDSQEFYAILQKIFYSYNWNDYLIAGGDFSAHWGKRFKNIIGIYGENVLNENRKLLRYFETFNSIRIRYWILF